jgi:hypothetical protein
MFYADPQLAKVNILFAYKNFRALQASVSHDGLGISSLLCVRVLRKRGIRADVRPVVNVAGIAAVLDQNPTCTHLVIQAPWLGVRELAPLVDRYPTVHFVVICHSQVSFLQADPGAVANLTDYLTYQESVLNFSAAVNNQRLQRFVTQVYQARCLLLPNLYDVTPDNKPPVWRIPQTKDVLRIGSFGATRVLKNHLTAGSAALMVARLLGTHLEFWVSGSRTDGGPQVIPTLQSMFRPLKTAKVVVSPWEPWPSFRKTIAGMDLCLQVSFTESFNITTADGCDSYIPSVVSEAIEWTPPAWQVNPDDPEAIARTGLYLLCDRDSGPQGKQALTEYADQAARRWLAYLGSNPT